MTLSEKIIIAIYTILYSIIISCNISFFNNQDRINFYKERKMFTDCKITKLNGLNIHDNEASLFKAITKNNDTIIFSSYKDNITDKDFIILSNREYIKYNYDYDSYEYKQYLNYIRYASSVVTLLITAIVLMIIFIIRNLVSDSIDNKYIDNNTHIIIFFIAISIIIYDLINF